MFFVLFFNRRVFVFLSKITQMITVEIPESFLQSPPVYSVGELKNDLAVLLYRRKKMSLAKAARWCGMTRLEFQSAMSERGVEIHFTEEDLQHDLKTLDKFFSK
jgi:predicted HTH domain antitoxin